MAIYARQSLDRHGDELAVGRQLELCRRFAESKGWTVAGEYVDNDRSATSGARRPEFERLLEDRPPRIVVWHIDRLVRLTHDLERVIDLGVNVHAVEAGHVDLSNPAGRAVAKTITAWSQYETEQKAVRQRAANDQRAAAGLPYAAQRAFGFEPDGVTVRAAEAEVIQRATKGVLAGRSVSAVARELNGQGITTATGGSWNHQELKRVLLRPRNAGLLGTGNSEDYNVEIIGKASWEPIVDVEEHEALSRMLTDASRRRKAGWSHLKWFGSGIYVCGRCGGRMRSSSIHTAKRKMSTYRCAEFSHVVIMAEKTDDYVRGVVTEVVRDPRVVRALTAGESDVMQADRQRRELLQTRLDQTDEDYDEDLIDARRYKAKRDKLMAELTEVEDRLAAGVEHATMSPIFAERDPGQAFLDAPLDEQRAVFRSVLRVTIKPNEKRGAAWSSDRLLIESVTDADDVESASA